MLTNCRGLLEQEASDDEPAGTVLCPECGQLVLEMDDECECGWSLSFGDDWPPRLEGGQATVAPPALIDMDDCMVCGTRCTGYHPGVGYV